MTPREPDRFDKLARELTRDHIPAHVVAAALRSARDDALNEAAYIAESYGCDYAGREIHALASPTAAPAVETERCKDGLVRERLHYRCTKLDRHPGPHADGDAEWDNTADVAQVDAPAAEGECWSDVHWCAQHGQPLSECTAQGRAGAPAAPPSEPVAPAPDPCQRCGKLGGHPVDFRFDGIAMSSWICPHCLGAQEKRIAELEKERDHWRGACVKAMVTGEYPVSPHDDDPQIKSLREAAEASFHGQAYAEKARQLREAEALLRECGEAVREAVEDGSWAFKPLLAKLAAQKETK